MPDDTPRPQINSAKISTGGGIAGAIFTIGSMLIFLFGIPMLRYVFPAAVILGCAVALFLHIIRRETPGAPWILAATEKKTAAPLKQELNGDRGRSATILVDRPATC